MSIRSVQLWTTITAVVLAPLFFGSVDLFWVVVWTIVLSFSALCSVAIPLSPHQNRIIWCFLALYCVYALVAIVQIIPNIISDLTDPIWREARGLVDIGVLPRISSRAEISPFVIGHSLLFLVSSLSGLAAGASSKGERLIRAIRYSIIGYVLYGFGALILTPDLVLWAPKAYQGSLTATFINHNTAATFVGAGTILWFCSAVSAAQKLRLASLRLLLLTQSNEALVFNVIARASATMICFFALLLTESRGGLICTCFGLLTSAALMLTSKRKLRFWHKSVLLTVTLLATIALLSQMGKIGSKGAFDEGRWSVYQMCFEAIRRRPWLGVGAGTFVDFFPSLRSYDFNSWGVLDYAHSTILELAVEMGVPVAVLIATASLASLFFVGRAVALTGSNKRSSLAAVAGIMVLSYLHSLIDFSLQIPGYFIIFAVLVGYAMSNASDVASLSKNYQSQKITC